RAHPRRAARGVHRLRDGARGHEPASRPVQDGVARAGDEHRARRAGPARGGVPGRGRAVFADPGCVSAMAEERSGPLLGVRVLDLTHVLNGPFCTMLLAHMGADVLKLEYGGGDRFRHAWMPIDADHDGYEFLAVNANKRGFTLNLKHERGRALFLELVERSDVVVENFSVGVMDLLGLSYEELRAVNPGIVYAASRGFGDSGPHAVRRANAQTIMASTGWTNATWEFSGRPGTVPQ